MIFTTNSNSFFTQNEFDDIYINLHAIIEILGWTRRGNVTRERCAVQ